MTSKTLLTAAVSIALLGAISAPATAQTPSAVRPAFHATHEGNASFSYPFGRERGGIQSVLDGAFVTSQPSASIVGLYFRHDGENFGTAWSGFTQDWVVKMATVPTTPQTMVADPTTNYAGAIPQTVFTGPLNIPASNAQPLAPRAWSIFIPTGIYTFDPANGNLLIDVQIDTNNVTLPPNRINVDGLLYRSAYVEGDVEAYTTDCVNTSNESLRYIPSKANLLVGGSIDATLTSRAGTTSTPGLFPGALVAFGASNNPIDLSILGTNGCWWSPTLDVTLFLPDTGAGFPAIASPIPMDPSLSDAVLYTQAFGLAATLQLADSVTSEAYWLRLGPMPSQGSNWPLQTIFSNNIGNGDSWFISNAGPFGPVYGFSGSL